MFDGNSTIALDYTFQYSKLSCWKPFYAAHMTFAYLVFLIGIACMITRLWTRFHGYHLWLGRLYIICMLWATATSLLIHNTGLPVANLYQFFGGMLMMTFGWIAITIHQKIPFKPRSEKRSVIASKISKVLTLKAFHGCCMFVSWIQIAGRLSTTNPIKDFSCYAVQVYKPMSDNHHFRNGSSNLLRIVEQTNPEYNRLPWANMERSFGALLFLVPFFGSFIIGIIYVTITPSKKLASTNCSEETIVT